MERITALIKMEDSTAEKKSADYSTSVSSGNESTTGVLIN